MNLLAIYKYTVKSRSRGNYLSFSCFPSFLAPTDQRKSFPSDEKIFSDPGAHLYFQFEQSLHFCMALGYKVPYK